MRSVNLIGIACILALSGCGSAEEATDEAQAEDVEAMAEEASTDNGVSEPSEDEEGR